MHVKTIILGGGISGLTAAFRLHEASEEFLLLESEDRIGGKVISSEQDGHILEHGPNTFLSSYAPLMELIDRLGLHGEIRFAAPEAKKRYVLRNRRLVALPTTPKQLIATRLLGPLAKLRLLLEPVVARRSAGTDESFERFVARHFGRQVVQRIAGPFVSGIFAGDPAKLSVAAAFPQVYRLEQEHRSLFKAMKAGAQRPRLCSVAGGIGQITKHLASRVQEETVLNAYAQRIQWREDHYLVTTGTHEYDCDHLILAVPAYAAMRLLEEINAPAAAELRDIPSVPVKVIHSIVPRAAVAHPMDGFGYLVPRGEKIRHLGTIFNTACFPHHSREGEALLTTFMGGAFDAEAVDTPDDQLLEELQREHATLGIYTGEPIYSSVTAWPRAIPQYHLGHLERIARLYQSMRKTPGIHLAGNYLNGISLGACVESGNTAADSVLTGPRA